MIKISQDNGSLEEKIFKYLSFKVYYNEKLPNSICKDCDIFLAKIDEYAKKCLQVQCMFASLVGDGTWNDKTDSQKEVKIENDFTPCNGKSDDLGNADNDGITKSDNSKINTPHISFPKKEEENEDFQDVLDFDMSHDFMNSSDEDNKPLISLELKPCAKVKKKKTKKGVKVKLKRAKKKSSKKKSLELDEILDGIGVKADVDVKNEPYSDDELNKEVEMEIIQEEVAKESQVLSVKSKRRLKSEILGSCVKYECYVCGQDCRNWHALCNHFRDAHSGRAKVMCMCGKFLASRISIGRHCAKHGKVETFDCGSCDKRFLHASELEMHTASHLPVEQRPYVCCKCARRFTTPQLLRHHERMHTPVELRMVHNCNFCQTKFATKSGLAMHIRAVHERLRPFVCDQCGKTFSTKGILEEHKVRHSDARPHVCEICNKCFKTKQRLTIHADTHEGTVYQCPHCPTRLNSRRTLRMHLFVHDSVARYKCNFCDKAFKRAKDLKNHNNLHTGVRPYSCPWCARTFANGSNCRAHKRRIHPVQLAAAEALQQDVSAGRTESNKDEKVNQENSEPIVIYTTVKRKAPLPSVIQPNFITPLDVTEKEIDIKKINKITEKLHIPRSDSPKISHVSQTKQEQCSPSHNSHESSMSPLNLNSADREMVKPLQINGDTILQAELKNLHRPLGSTSQNHVVLPHDAHTRNYSDLHFKNNLQLHQMLCKDNDLGIQTFFYGPETRANFLHGHQYTEESKNNSNS